VPTTEPFTRNCTWLTMPSASEGDAVKVTNAAGVPPICTVAGNAGAEVVSVMVGAMGLVAARTVMSTGFETTTLPLASEATATRRWRPGDAGVQLRLNAAGLAMVPSEAPLS